jgi:DNA-binding Xre family transcriptional regulator
MNLPQRIAKNIQKIRKTSITKLADKAGLSKYTLARVLYCRSKDVQVSTLLKIAKALKVSMDKLVK